jgi:phenylpropionate dioxygenase-like ring-hydroxylating dioxygenase large terminal subunit
MVILLREGQQADLSKIRTKSFPCVERQGLIWVYFAKGEETPRGTEAEPPRLPVFADDVGPTLAIKMHFACSADHAAFGLMDPTHAAYVHTSWWFKKQGSKLRPKEKAFEPSTRLEDGAPRLAAAEPVYKPGKNVSTEISYRLPGLRIEEVRATGTPWSGSPPSP